MTTEPKMMTETAPYKRVPAQLAPTEAPNEAPTDAPLTGSIAFAEAVSAVASPEFLAELMARPLPERPSLGVDPLQVRAVFERVVDQVLAEPRETQIDLAARQAKDVIDQRPQPVPLVETGEALVKAHSCDPKTPCFCQIRTPQQLAASVNADVMNGPERIIPRKLPRPAHERRHHAPGGGLLRRAWRWIRAQVWPPVVGRDIREPRHAGGAR
jgi:hypothetical protein